jgi:hypothetical protein
VGRHSRLAAFFMLVHQGRAHLPAGVERRTGLGKPLSEHHQTRTNLVEMCRNNAQAARVPVNITVMSARRCL